MEKINESIHFDKRIWEQAIRGSEALRTNIITNDDVSLLLNGLSKVRAEWANGAFVLKPGDEDIHTANERRLTELIGPTGANSTPEAVGTIRFMLKNNLPVGYTKHANVFKSLVL